MIANVLCQRVVTGLGEVGLTEYRTNLAEASTMKKHAHGLVHIMDMDTIK